MDAQQEWFEAVPVNGYLIHGVRDRRVWPDHPSRRTRELVYGPALCGVKGRDSYARPTLVLVTDDDEKPQPFRADRVNISRPAYDGTQMNEVCPRCLARARHKALIGSW